MTLTQTCHALLLSSALHLVCDSHICKQNVQLAGALTFQAGKLPPTPPSHQHVDYTTQKRTQFTPHQPNFRAAEGNACAFPAPLPIPLGEMDG